MKIVNYLILFSTLLVFESCKQVEAFPYYGIDFLFKEAQPINDRELKKLPTNLIGSYINQDSTYLLIDKKMICYKWITKNYLSHADFSALKDSLLVIDNTIYFKDNVVQFRKLKDSVEVISSSYDTLFFLSERNKAKRIKGKIILNTKDNHYWKLKILSLERNTLSIKSLVSDEDKTRLDSLSQVNVKVVDSTKNIFEVSKQEFKKMLDLKNFGYIQEYKKLN